MRIEVGNDSAQQDLAWKDAEKVAKATLSQKPSSAVNKPHKHYMLALRCSVVLCIMIVAACIGYFAYYVVQSAEMKQCKDAYQDLTRQLLPAANTGIWKSAASVMNAAAVIGALFPNSTHWPYVAAAGFPKMAVLGSALSGAAGFSVSPLVLPHEVADFENFAYDYYAKFPSIYPPNAGMSSFGRGIASFDFSLTDVPDRKYHDTNGNTSWPSTADFQFLTPTLQIDGTGTSRHVLQMMLMINARKFEIAVQQTQDAILQCVAHRVHGNETCTIVSGIKAPNPIFSELIHVNIAQPIIAMDKPDKIVGFVSASVFFDFFLNDLIPAGTDGIDFVIQSDRHYFTYRIHNGVTMYHGDGDYHDTRYDDWRESTDLKIGQIGDDEFRRWGEPPPAVYTISFYPNEAYLNQFRTELRWVFCFGSVVLIMLVCVIFGTYDHFMVRENTEQQAVLDTKRQFVRFISHEVRTPLNAVAMAGDLMRDQLLGVMKTLHQDLPPPGRSPPLSPRLALGPGLSSENASMEVVVEDSLELCREIVANTKKAVEVLDDLLNYDKIEVGGLSLDLSFVAIECIVQSVMKPFKGPAKQKNINMETNMSQYLRSAVFEHPRLFHDKFCALRVVGDKIRLEQVIRNLISNAIKFTSAQGNIVVTLEWVEDSTTIHNPPSHQLKHFLHPSSSPLALSRSNSHNNTVTKRTERTELARSMDVEGEPSRGQSIQPRAPSPKREASAVMESDRSTYANTITNNTNMNTNMRNSLEMIEVEGDDEIARQAILKASASRTPEPRSMHRWGCVRLSVADDGAGLTPEQLRVVCSQGVQFNANELQAGQGSGLGLFIAKGIVKQHGGQMTVTSEGLQKGSTFLVELPVYACDVFYPEECVVLAQAKRDAAAFAKFGVFGSSGIQRIRSSMVDLDALGARTAAEELLFGASVSGSDRADKEKGIEVGERVPMRRVLVVDDVESNRKMAIRLLQRSGVEVCEQAVDGQQAVDAYTEARTRAHAEELTVFQQKCAVDAQNAAMNDQIVPSVPPEPQLTSTEPFDAILMDFEMPIMNGPSATKRLRALGCRALIIGISGNVLKADVEVFLAHGADAVLPKPFKFAELEKIWQTRVTSKRNNST